ncbi:MAG: hypothetical protein ACR2K5_09375 [Pseudolabrys sp.]
MRFGLAFAAVAAFGLLSAPADAQTRTKRVVTRNADHTVSVTRDEDGRTRTRIIVQQRSYLDAGNNVLPGERKYLDYVIPPTSSINPAINNTAFNFGNSNLPGPFDLPSKNNPMQW